MHVECLLCARHLNYIMNRKEKVLVFGTYAFGEDVYKSKITTNRIPKNRKNPTFTWERGKK